jgi:hypothetical protein
MGLTQDDVRQTAKSTIAGNQSGDRGYRPSVTVGAVKNAPSVR